MADRRRIGLLGGTFDPPHAGHLHITGRALNRLGLDAVWWLVAPRNPLKARAPADMDRRLAACRALLDGRPRVWATGIERRLNTRCTADTLAALARRFPGARFVWLMGADNLAQFHRWRRWRWIAANFPICALARPGQQLRAGLSPMAQSLARRRLPESRAGELGRGPLRATAPRWVLLTGTTAEDSSTALRARAQRGRPGAP